ncbi:MAG: aminodeoxychorismate/anthranilate synthase component II [Oligosphaeraceae bacterium]|nr:aminodeoxychorismate/anthranilate synthase component II [Oligosphaeraceae bacterium]
MILVLDNFDSFIYNLVHMLYALHAEVEVYRNNQITLDEVLALRPDAIVLSSGAGRPEHAGIMQELILAAHEQIPILGVCLGHQAIGQVFGAKIVPTKQIMHGKVSKISHNGENLFAGLKNDFKAVRYHSLALHEDSLPEELEVTARSEDGEIMGIRHRDFLIYGIQYHPESILSPNGKQQLANFMQMVDLKQRKGV